METIIASDYEIERQKPMPSKQHAIVQMNLGICINAYTKKYKLASELSLSLNGWLSVPDICIFTKSFSFEDEEIHVSTPPLGVIEILSPTQSMNEFVEKAKKYFQNGVKSYWLVIPALKSIHVFKTIQEYEVYQASQTLKDAVLEIELELKEIFV